MLGNAISGEQVIVAMEEAFLRSSNEDLEERLHRSIEASRDAGGQPEGQRSAALVVYDCKDFARVDLRVDLHEEPVGELRRIFDLYRPAIPYDDLRQVDPRVPPLDQWLAERST